MKRLFLTLSIVFALISCDDGGVNEQKGIIDPINKGLEYLTITYHSEGHTAGEVPVDPKHYPVPSISDDFPPHYIVEPEMAIVLDRGTLEKEGAGLNGWLMRRPEGDHYDRLYYPSNWGIAKIDTLDPEGRIPVRHNIEFDAAWSN